MGMLGYCYSFFIWAILYHVTESPWFLLIAVPVYFIPSCIVWSKIISDFIKKSIDKDKQEQYNKGR